MHYTHLRCALRSTQIMRQNLTKLVTDAERLIGYQGSHMGLGCLLTDEVANVALAATKLIGTNHPLLKTAKHLLSNGNAQIQTRGILGLLITKSLNLSICSDLQLRQNGNEDSILLEQRNLTEISELIWTAFLMHRGCLNIENMPQKMYNKLSSGNKMAILGGDFLLANASQALAKIAYPEVTNRYASSIADISQAPFIHVNSTQSLIQYISLDSASLLGSCVWSCSHILTKKMSNLDENSPAIINSGVKLGRNMAILLCLHDLTHEIDTNFDSEIDLEFLKSSKAELFTKKSELVNECLDLLNIFVVSDSVLALGKMLKEIGES